MPFVSLHVLLGFHMSSPCNLKAEGGCSAPPHMHEIHNCSDSHFILPFCAQLNTLLIHSASKKHKRKCQTTSLSNSARNLFKTWVCTCTASLLPFCLLLMVKVLHEILASSHYQSWRQVGRARMAWQYVLCSPLLVGWNKNVRRKRKLNMACNPQRAQKISPTWLKWGYLDFGTHQCQCFLVSLRDQCTIGLHMKTSHGALPPWRHDRAQSETRSQALESPHSWNIEEKKHREKLGKPTPPNTVWQWHLAIYCIQMGVCVCVYFLSSLGLWTNDIYM